MHNENKRRLDNMKLEEYPWTEYKEDRGIAFIPWIIVGIFLCGSLIVLMSGA